MNYELRQLLIKLLEREDDIVDIDFFYDTEFDALMKMFDEILSNE